MLFKAPAGEEPKMEGVDFKKGVSNTIRKARRMSHKSHMDIFKVFSYF